jgi:ATP-dependent Clp protease ATP-binding subunit ClpC
MSGYSFTERVRRVIAMAREEAILLRHEYVGTEHILLGLIREGEGLAITVLQNLSASPPEIGDAMLETIAAGRSWSGATELPYTARAKKVLELAMAEAREMHHSYVGTEHLLLGLLAERTGIAAQALTRRGITLENVRAETLRLLGSASSDAGRHTASSAPTVARGGPEPSRIVVELHFRDGSTKRCECRDRREAMTFLMQH